VFAWLFSLEKLIARQTKRAFFGSFFFRVEGKTMDRSSLHLKRFDPSTMDDCFNAVIIGHKHTGKSTLIRDMIYRLHVKGYPRIVVFSGTESGNDFFSKCVPKAYVHHGMDIEKFKSIIDIQRKIVASCRDAESRLGKSTNIDTRLVIILDDLMYKKAMTKAEIFGELFLNGRHFKLSIILTTQYLMSLDIACRSNVDYLFVLREMIPRNRQRLYENFFGIFARKQDFYHVLDSCTKNYECLVLDNTNPNMQIERSIFWYRAALDLPQFTFGNHRFHDWATDSNAATGNT
jgi:hypothetical protein